MALASLLLLALLALPAPAAFASPTRWVAPLYGPLDVQRAFAPPATRWGPGHRGVDLAAPSGALVRAAGAGTVTYASGLAGRGVLVVRHGALRTTYEPVSPLAAVGTAVVAGEPVATVDAGHGGTSPPDALLHWGLLRGDVYLDPLLLLRRGPSRLVPVAPAPPAHVAGSPLVAGAAVPRPPPEAPADPGVPRAVTAAAAPALLGAALAAHARGRRRGARSRASP